METKSRLARIAAGRTVPMVPPLYQASMYLVPDLDTFDRIKLGRAQAARSPEARG